MAVSVTPDTFAMVDFDAAVIGEVAGELAASVGLPAEFDVEIAVDEGTPLARVRVESVEPLSLRVEGGAFEDPKRPRQLSRARVVDVVGLHFFQTRDRLDPSIGAPPVGADLPIAHKVAWDTHAMGRLERLGHPAQRQRRLYHFRNRHGFTDAADAAFDRLWSADHLTWAELTSVSDTAAAARVG